MADPSIAGDGPWDHEGGGTSFRAVAAPAGARDLGASLYVLEPGAAASPYHLHHGNEELLVVLGGRPSIRTPDGLRELPEGAVVAFLPGYTGAHRIVNRSDAEARVLVVSTMRVPEVVEHLDTGGVLVRTAPADGLAFPPDAARPFREVFVPAVVRGAEVDDEIAG